MLYLRGTKFFILATNFLFFLGCSGESKFSKIDSSTTDQENHNLEARNFESSESPSENDENEIENSISTESLDWLADLDLPDDQEVSEIEMESPIMITGAHLIGCTSNSGIFTCLAETEEGFDISTIEIFDLKGENISKDLIKLETVKEEGIGKIVITLFPFQIDHELSEQELCQVNEEFTWDLETEMCIEKIFTEEEICSTDSGFYWSAADRLCIEDGTEFGFSVSILELNTNIPLGADPIDIEFNLDQVSYVKYVDIYTDWFSKRPTDIKVYHSVDGAKGALIAEKNFPTRDDQICGEDFQSPCTYPEAPVSRLTVELNKMYQLSEVIVEVSGLLSQSQGFAIVMEAGLRN
ncbi:MAG: hypothetical protein AB8G05_11545 [Oligoflexales bacterium]